MSSTLSAKITIEKANQEAIRTLFESADADYRATHSELKNTPISAKEIDDSRGVLWVARVDGEVVGHVALGKLREDVYEIKRLLVVDEYRRIGIARKLLAVLEEFAKSAGAKSLVLETGTMQPAAISLYRRLNFEEVDAFFPYEKHPKSVFFEKHLE
ncbi:GNAT family N-acetyltransferase [Sulfitobacter sp. HNIBRBA2951]|uniref:GNAT family N-acetyltransferase n=1 Tax=Sulfitobacter aquimarinus TaxID=3158557 RepID=UPI0032DF2440